MMLFVTHLLALAVGVIVAGAYARRQIAKIQRDDLSFRMAPVIPHSIEDAARRVGA